MGSRAAVDVFAYRDYRAFLAAFYARRKAQRGGYSFAEFAKAIGSRSPNYLKLVIDGDRNLSSDMAHRFGDACGLRDEALDFFCRLVAFNQARSADERERHYRALQTFRRFRATHKLDGAQSAYHSEWYIPAIHELAALPDFDADPKWIAKQLVPAISPKQAAGAIETLKKLQLLVERDGRWVQVDPALETEDGPLGHHVVQYHRAMMARAAEALDVIDREEREIASLTLCVSEEHLQEIKRELTAFRTRLFERYMTEPSPERVVQVNFQMFPLSGKRKG